jgi:hypothetical protein
VHAYRTLPSHHFWRSQVSGRTVSEINYDPSPKFTFDLSQDCFATAGSCFAQHFGRELSRRGGRLYFAEALHPLIPEGAEVGYGLFSARYGNIYTPRQLKELIEQAFGMREPIFEWAQGSNKRYVDMLRPRAPSDGFTSPEEACADRLFHLSRVKNLFQEASVFVFTLGLTECWENAQHGYVYPICPGVAAGEFDQRIHRFINLTYAECIDDMRRVFGLILRENPTLRILLTVSPVMLVASYENCGALQASMASKGILRAVAETCRKEWETVDYFPAYEIINGPQARGTFYDEGCRDVTAEGVAVVMDAFFASRFGPHASTAASVSEPVDASRSTPPDIKAAIEVECDELLLDS